MKSVFFTAVLAIQLVGCGSKSNSSISNVSEATQSEKTYEGTLKLVFAAGGETTGYALETSSRTIELNLKIKNLENQFSEGKKVKVSGYFETVKGVENTSREVFVVTKIQSQPEKTLKGKLILIASAGGGTPYGLELPNGKTVELDLPNDGLKKQFKEDLKVELTGSFKTLKNPDRGEFQVFIVTKIRKL